ncbi:MAG: acyl--CoA ligase [Clostridiales bacterium]|nr:acyl--CoA ligase [Clostridiales bacterium]
MNLSEAIATWANRRGDAIALTGVKDITYKELDNYARSYAQQIMEVLPYYSQKIAILAHDNISFIFFLLSIIRSGNAFVLINPMLSTNQINKSLDEIKCEYYISNSPRSDIHAKYIPIDLHTTFVDNDSETIYPNIGITADAGVIFSSGTTGEPKALMRSSYSILSETIQWIIELQLHIGTSFLIPRPLYYTGGFILMYASLFSGGRVDLLDDLSYISVLEYVQNVSVDWAFIVPSVIREINATNSYSHMAKNVLTMGSPIFHSDKIAFYNKFKCNLIEVWGNSEGLGTITEPSDLFEHPFSIGKPFFTDYLNVTNNEGQLFGISDNEFSEYIGQPELTQMVLHEGYIYSEDLGYKDENGYFYLTGRMRDIIVVDGVKVFPSDIERELLSTKKIYDCAVFSTRDDNGNDIVSAALVMKEDHIPYQLICSINSNLAPHERIRRYILLNAIPRNHGGKIDKKVLVVPSIEIYEVE